MSENKEPRFKGIASLYTKEQLQEFFRSYLVSMCLIEGLIFFVCFIYALKDQSTPFPWKPFVFASFITPIIVTFIFGVIVIGFNKYLYQTIEENSAVGGSLMNWEGGFPNPKLDRALYYIQKIPFLIGLLLLVAGTGIIYKIDAIILYIGRLGEKVAEYILIASGTVLGIATLLVLFYIYLSYRLRHKKLNYQYQYRKDVMDKMGLVILDDNSIVDRQGKMIDFQSAKEIAHDDNAAKEITVVPKLPR